MRERLPFLITGVLVLATAVAAAPPAVNLPPGVDPTKLRVTTFASGLNFPTGMQQLSDGSILVAASNNPGGTGTFYASPSGSLLRFTDANQDGVADGAPIDLAPAGLGGAITSIRQAGNLLFVNHAAEPSNYRMSVLRRGATPTSPYTSLGLITFTYPATQWQHHNYGLAVRSTPGGGANMHDVFFGVGSRDNNPDTPAGVDVTTGGLLSTTLAPDSIHKVTVTDNGGSNVTLTNPRQVAVGVRNGAGIAFHPSTGDLWFQDNGIDGISGDANEPLSVDELNRIAAASVGGAVEHFGFSDDYIAYRTGARVGSGAIQPEVAFLPVPNPANGAEAEGANEIAFAPTGFPSQLNNGVFVGFHGKFNMTGTNNEENAVVYYDLAADTYYHFISPRQAGIGHLDGLLATTNALFLSDFTTGSFFGPPFNQGSVYQVSFVPEPAAGLMVVALGAIGWMRRTHTPPREN